MIQTSSAVSTATPTEKATAAGITTGKSMAVDITTGKSIAVGSITERSIAADTGMAMRAAAVITENRDDPAAPFLLLAHFFLIEKQNTVRTFPMLLTSCNRLIICLL